MIIKSIFIGNAVEAFLEDKFSERFNILYSDDNNKGKTIVYSIVWEIIRSSHLHLIMKNITLF